MEYQLKLPLLPLEEHYDVVERVFAIRGISPQDKNHLLNTTDEDILDPLLLDNMETGAKMLIKHIAAGDKTLFIVDSDADGMTSSAAMINYLYKLFPSYVLSNIDYRLHTGKQHGLEDQTDYILTSNQYKLVICPDSASNNFEHHAALKAAGIDVLVLDHHEAERVSEDACIINNQLCDYPTKSLSGVGIVYKFCCYLDSILGKSYADDILDLVAVGIVSDMMDLRDFETQRIVQKGLQNIKNPFIAQMVETQNYSISKGGGLCPFTISFYVTPQINGTIRMGNDAEKLLVFESMLDFKGWERIPSTKRGCKGQLESRAEQACRTCASVKRAQAKEVDLSSEVIEGIIENKNLLDNKIIAVKLDKQHATNKNLTGLIANRLMSKYKHPILILSQRIDQETGKITWDGSGRGYETATFNNLREFLNESGLVEYAEGHAQAMGVSVADENFDKLITYANTKLANCDFNPCYKVDFIWHAADFTSNDIIKIADLGTIWGQGIEEPLIAIENIHVTPNMVTLMSRDRNPTLKITLANGTSIIKFKASEEEYQNLLSDTEMGSVDINIVGKCALNEWNGSISAQILLEDYEIIGKTAYLF